MPPHRGGSGLEPRRDGSLAPVGARRLLTPRTQEALVHLRRHLGRSLWGAARGEYLWLAVENGGLSLRSHNGSCGFAAEHGKFAPRLETSETRWKR